MKQIIFLCICFIILRSDINVAELVGKDTVRFQPQQVHLSFGEKVNDVVVTWSTVEATNQSAVIYSDINHKQQQIAKGTETRFIDGGIKQATQYIHKVILRDLMWHTGYSYICGSELNWSKNFTFFTPPQGSGWSPSVAIYGDLGFENAVSVPYLLEDVKRNMYDAIIHVGDIAYDLDSDNGMVGDNFMQLLEPIAASVPYMVCPGNHERKYNFSNYKARFNMPGTYDSLWYSFNMGPIHFISYSSEVYYFMEYGLKLLTKQYAWLENDLKIANEPQNRNKRPWIITYGHRPFYCSYYLEYDCNEKLETMVRRGLPGLHWFGLEDLFYKYKVDVEFFGHEHFYSRLWPMYNFTVFNGSTEHPYTNAKAPIHIITGAAGSKEHKEPFSRNLPSWNAFHASDYAYNRLKAHNGTHLYLELISDEQNGTVIDQFWIIKNKYSSLVNY